MWYCTESEGETELCGTNEEKRFQKTVFEDFPTEIHMVGMTEYFAY